MDIKALAVVLFLFLVVNLVSCAHRVKFEGTTTPGDAEPLELTGVLTKPDGDGPFPAVVLLHGCAGITRCEDTWAERLRDRGFVSLKVNSLAPRDKSNICSDPLSVSPETQAQDAFDAKSYLAGLEFVDHNRIAVIGWSQGGTSALFAASAGSLSQTAEDTFRAAIAFYPFCEPEPLRSLNTPLLVMIGEKDGWSSARLCADNVPGKVFWVGEVKQKTTHEVVLKVYPGAYHRFDCRSTDPSAATDAVIRVMGFLEKYMQ